MIGIPPLSGFASKLYFATAALETPYAVLVVPVAIIVSTVLSAMYYVPVMFHILSKRSEPVSPKISAGGTLSLSYRTTLAAFTALTFFLGLFPQQILRVIEQGLAVFG
jgi:NADH:ubiquinone oxidoreductase subunit 2 (subunit N)